MINFTNLLISRRSVRKFTDKKIESEKIEELKKAILLAPTGKRKNHWGFIFIENNETLLKLSVAKEFGSKLVANASLAIVVIGDPQISDTWIEDCAIASIIAQLKAEELGLGSCWVQIDKRFSKDKRPSKQIVKNLLNIPDGKEVLSVIALGYPLEKPKPFDLEKLDYSKIHSEIY